MESVANFNLVFGGLITILLSIIAYFIRQLHTDFKNVEKDLIEVKTTTSLIKSELKSGYDLLNQKVGFIERRVDNLEAITLKKKEDERQ